ncbi:MAG: hypothetical protein IAF58_11575 [Leptolyngbya sp.]|nr:hypothetical protein [Candidatus Melainabacteria bacterium]
MNDASMRQTILGILYLALLFGAISIWTTLQKGGPSQGMPIWIEGLIGILCVLMTGMEIMLWTDKQKTNKENFAVMGTRQTPNPITVSGTVEESMAKLEKSLERIDDSKPLWITTGYDKQNGKFQANTFTCIARGRYTSEKDIYVFVDADFVFDAVGNETEITWKFSFQGSKKESSEIFKFGETESGNLAMTSATKQIRAAFGFPIVTEEQIST